MKVIRRGINAAALAAFLTLGGFALHAQEAAPPASAQGAAKNAQAQSGAIDADKTKPTAPAPPDRVDAPAPPVVTTPAATNGAPSIERPATSYQARETNPERDGKLFNIIAKNLEHNHFLQKPLNEEIAQKFIKSYMETLDYNHLFFLQSDFDEFENTFGKEMSKYVAHADATPAFVIFSRFIDRLEQRKKMIDNLLKEKYDFTKDESFTPIRDKTSFPANDAEALALWRSRIKSELLQGRLEKKKPAATIKRVGERYANLVKTEKNSDNEEVLSMYLDALTRCYDPHSDYFSADEAKNFEIMAITLNFFGIGAELRSEDGYAKIQRLVPGGPADLDKRLKPNDRIAAVAQSDGEPVDVVDMRLQKVVDLIRGKRGTKVRLFVIPSGASDSAPRQEITIKRDEVKLEDSQAKAKVYEHVGPSGDIKRVGVINLPQFYKRTASDGRSVGCAEDVENLLLRLKEENVSGVILDLRRNGGGLLDEAIDLTGLFIKTGPVVQIKNSYGQVQSLGDTDPKVVWDGPLICMAGHLSASASEIVAGALQDYGRAIIVGDSSTHGKGSVQNLVKLDHYMGSEYGDPGELKLTVQKFYRIAGGSTQQKGVIPDINLPSLFDYLEIGESRLPNCLPYDEIDKQPFEAYNMVTPYLATLKTKSAERVEHSTDFTYLKQDIEILKQHLADKTVSLNEAKRIKERNDQKTQAEARKKERLARIGPKTKVYELTLDMVEKKSPLVEAKPVKVSATAAANAAASDSDEIVAEPEAALDPQLDETVNIMSDYIGMLSNKIVTTSITPR